MIKIGRMYNRPLPFIGKYQRSIFPIFRRIGIRLTHGYELKSFSPKSTSRFHSSGKMPASFCIQPSEMNQNHIFRNGMIRFQVNRKVELIHFLDQVVKTETDDSLIVFKFAPERRYFSEITYDIMILGRFRICSQSIPKLRVTRLARLVN